MSVKILWWNIGSTKNFAEGLKQCPYSAVQLPKHYLITYIATSQLSTMDQEFTVKNGLKIFYYLLAAALMSAGLFILTLPNKHSGLFYFMPIYFGAIGISIVVNAVRRKVTVINDTITVVGPFKTREIAISDIEGIRFGQKRITIVSKNPGQPDVPIVNYANLNSGNQLVNYLKGTFPDLDAVDLNEQQQSLLQDANLGLTAEERQAKLDKAKRTALVYNVIGVAIAVGCILLKQTAFIILAIAYPLLSIAVIITSNSLIKFLSDSQRSIYPFVVLGFIAPAIALFAKSLAFYRIYSFDNFWLPLVGLGLVLTLILFKTGINSSMNKNPMPQIILMIGASLFYAFGTLEEINCSYDKSPDQYYKASVLGHHISHGRSTNYYLYLSTWGPCQEQKEINVDRSFYDNTNVGDSVKIDLKPGLLHIPWFVVYRN